MSSYVLHPRPPFSFSQVLAFLRRFPPTLGDRAIVGTAVLGAARVDHDTIGLRISGEGDIDTPSLRCLVIPSAVTADAPVGSELGPDGTLPASTVEALLGRIGEWLGIDDDLGPFYALADGDPPFRAVVRQLYGYHQVRFFTPFENTCWAILGQRTPMGAARAARRRIIERCGGVVEIEGQTVLAFPEPDDLASLERQEMAALAGSERKADRLLAIAEAFLSVGPATLRVMPTDELGRWLQALPGIGPWSVTFILLRGFGRADAALPLGTAESFDRELLQAGRAVYGPDLTPAGLAEIAERYGNCRGSWGHYLRLTG